MCIRDRLYGSCYILRKYTLHSPNRSALLHFDALRRDQAIEPLPCIPKVLIEAGICLPFRWVLFSQCRNDLFDVAWVFHMYYIVHFTGYRNPYPHFLQLILVLHLPRLHYFLLTPVSYTHLTLPPI